MRKYNERGDAEWMFPLFIVWWFLIVILLITPSRYDTKVDCLDDWTKCERQGEVWVGTDDAERN